MARPGESLEYSPGAHPPVTARASWIWLRALATESRTRGQLTGGAGSTAVVSSVTAAIDAASSHRERRADRNSTAHRPSVRSRPIPRWTPPDHCRRGFRQDRGGSQRVADILAEGCHADSIVAFTFTERAAGELKQRIAQRVEQRLGVQPWIDSMASSLARSTPTAFDSCSGACPATRPMTFLTKTNSPRSSPARRRAWK